MHLSKPVETIKFILENLQAPERLENHPWALSAFSKEYLQAHPEARELSPGQQLSAAIAQLFIEWMPSNPPRKGKRLDNRWGEYGLLAAQYVTPLLAGTSSPRSFKEAWASIDQSIALLVSRRLSLTEEQIANEYQVIANEPEAANSTISDWHRKGIERFAEFVELREKHIEAQAIQKSQQEAEKPEKKKKRNYRPLILSITAILLLFLAAGSFWGYQKAQRILGLARELRQELQSAQNLNFSLETLKDPTPITTSLENIDINLRLLDQEVRPYLWMTSYLDWVPTYGGDIKNSPALLEMALLLNDSLQETYRGVSPLVETLNQGNDIAIESLINGIKESQPAVQTASQRFEEAMQQRATINTAQLSPEVRELLEEKIDPALTQMEKALNLFQALPNLLGASNNGPKTYMIVLQNEDELRATGGFVTTIGTVVIRDGEIVSMVFEDSYDLDDLSKPYPLPPWQLFEYMNASVYMLRDANWLPDFPTTVTWLEYLYAYTRGHSVDGVIAIDQYTLVRLLNATGPMRIEGYQEAISSENVLQVMRDSKVPPQDVKPSEWDRKEFISVLGPQIMDKIMAGQGFEWGAMIQTFTTLLNEKHILLQFDDPVVAQFVTEQGWAGQVQPVKGDFIMVVDSNIGFSKASMLIERKIEIEIDLSDLEKPRKNVRVEYRHPITLDQDCADPTVPGKESYYPITRCYGNYSRLYVPDGSLLTDYTAFPVPAAWTIKNQAVPAQVDIITDDVDDLGVFGTYFILPFGETLETAFELETPAEVIEQKGAFSYVYTLTIQKQPGTKATPVTFRLILPDDVIITKTPDWLTSENGVLSGEFLLREDRLIEIDFSY